MKFDGQAQSKKLLKNNNNNKFQLEKIVALIDYVRRCYMLGQYKYVTTFGLQIILNPMDRRWIHVRISRPAVPVKMDTC